MVSRQLSVYSPSNMGETASQASLVILQSSVRGFADAWTLLDILDDATVRVVVGANASVVVMAALARIKAAAKVSGAICIVRSCK